MSIIYIYIYERDTERQRNSGHDMQGPNHIKRVELCCRLDIHRKISISSSIPQVITTCLRGARSVLGIAHAASKMIILQEHIRVKSITHPWGLPLASPAPGFSCCGD